MNLLGRALLDFQDPPVKVLFIYNCNPVATVPDQNRVAKGLGREDLFTVLFEQTMTDTAPFADVLLPATTFLEHYDISKGYGAYHFHLTQPVIAPVGEARPNQEVFRELRVRLGQVEPVPPEEDLGEAGALMELAGRLPESLGPAVAQGLQSEPPGGSRPVQFVDVLPKTADQRAHLFPSEIGPPAGLYTYHAVPATAASTPLTPDFAGQRAHDFVDARRTAARCGAAEDESRGRAQPIVIDGRPFSRAIFNELGEVQALRGRQITPEICPGTRFLCRKALWARSTFNGATAKRARARHARADIYGGAWFQRRARGNLQLLARH